MMESQDAFHLTRFWEFLHQTKYDQLNYGSSSQEAKRSSVL